MIDARSRILPAATEIVVIGGGIIGAITALELAERGIPVVLCEKGELGGEQSGLNLGWCRQLGRDVRELPLSIQALGLWGGMNERVGGETGFRRSGILHLASSEQELSGFRERVSSLGSVAAGIGLECIGPSEIASLTPGATKSFPGGLYCKTDGRAEPTLATAAVVSAARRKGAVIQTRCAVRGFDIADGRIVGVVTEKSLIRCGAVVLAGGIWSRHLLRSIGIGLPQLLVSETLLRTTAIDIGHQPSLTTGRVAHRPVLGGGYVIAHEQNTLTDIIPASFRYAPRFLPAMVSEFNRLRFRLGRTFIREALFPYRWQLNGSSPFERLRHVQPEPSTSRVLSAFQEMKTLFPALRDAAVQSVWSGYIDVMPDAIPVISPVPQMKGLWLATGFSGHGFGVAPAAARLVADLVTNNTPSVDPAPFSFSRFSSAGMQHLAHKHPTNSNRQHEIVRGK